MIFARILLFVICAGLLFRGYMVSHEPEDSSYEPDFVMTEVSFLAGINFHHEQFSFKLFPDFGNKGLLNVSPWLSSQGASTSVVDVNNDDWPDIYLTSMLPGVPNKLFINQKDGTFKEEAARYGIAELNGQGVSSRTFFFDADNDGNQELLLVTASCPRLFKLDKKFSYKEYPLPTPLGGCTFSVAGNIFDYDQDGLLDIVISGATGMGFETSDNLPQNFAKAENGAATIIFKNNGNMEFTQVGDLVDRQKKLLFANAIGVGDFRGKDPLDIWFATDFNNDYVYFHEGNGYLPGHSLKGSLAKSGMSAELGYLGDETPMVFVSHVYRSFYYPHGNNLWKYEDGEFKDYAIKYDVNRCGWAWGARFADFNNDSYSDLYVANGFYNDQSTPGVEPRDYWYKLGLISSTLEYFVSKASNWPSMDNTELSGKDRDCLFLNQGDKKFINISKNKKFEVDALKLNGRSVALIDFKNNGSPGVLITNQLSRPYLYDVEQKNSHSWIGFKLQGTKSNRDGVGAKVYVYRDNQPVLIRQSTPFNGYVSQSDLRLHFGLGDYSGKVRVRIHWVGGAVQEINDLSINQYHKVIEQ